MRIAVVGTGIAGLGAAYLLSRVHDVEVFERDRRVGGHAHTVRHVDSDGRELALDTGFLVHNRENYPNLVRLFGELGVRTQASEMSFSVSCGRCGLEYSGARPWLQGRNLMSPDFVRLMAEIVRFMRTAPASVRDDETLGQFVTRRAFGDGFRDHFLLPLTAALWSTAPGEALDFPAAYAIRFFDHHGMLRFRRFRWRTVVGGAETYVQAIRRRLPRDVRAGEPVVGVRRDAGAVTLRLQDGRAERFDSVVIATHPDQALAMLDDADEDERRVLGAFHYTANETVLHTDQRLLPRRASARGAWNYHVDDCRSPAPVLAATYSLNRLQRLGTGRQYLVSLNRGAEIAPDQVIARMSYEHPRYTFATLAAQRSATALNGARRTWFCGAWQGYGFHEDGLRSAVEVARGLGVTW